jgi:hypothetical protein
MKFPSSLLALISIGPAMAISLPASNAAGRDIEVLPLIMPMTIANQIPTQKRAPCGDLARAVPFLRAYNAGVANHFYTTNVPEMQNALNNLGYIFEGTTGHLFPSQEPGTVPLYRLYSAINTDHFYTASAAERDSATAGIRLGPYASEGVAGYIYPDAVCGGQPLYRMYKAGTDHFYTASTSERNDAVQNGWSDEGVAGYLAF